VKRFCLVLLGAVLPSLSAWGQTAEQKKETVAYVQSLQAADGGFLPARAPSGQPQPPSSVRATSSALRALKYFGGEPRDREACVKFVQSRFDQTSGGFADHPGGKPDVASTAVGMMAVVELKLPVDPHVSGVVAYLGEHAKTFEDIRIAAAGLESISKRPAQGDAWLKQIAELRNPDGTYGQGDGTARATGGAVAAVLRLGGKVEQRDHVVAALKKGQRPDGAVGKEGTSGSDLETSYRVLRSLVMLKEKPADIEPFRGFVARCRNADGGYGVAPGQPSTTSATYFASIILHWLAEK
jgi:prenyltransferase beta subunit